MTTWIKLHDNFWENPKVLAAGEDAALLYVQGLSYCSRNLTDGAIPTPALRNLTAKREAKTLARILTREGLWSETATGWQVHDYLKVQRSREQVEAEREKARTRKAKSRSGHTVTPTVTDAPCHADVTQPDTDTDTETDNYPPTPLPVSERDHGEPPQRIPPEFTALAIDSVSMIRAQHFGLPDSRSGDALSSMVTDK